MTIEEFFAERDRRFEEVFDAEPGEQRLKAFGKFEHRSNGRYDDIEREASLSFNSRTWMRSGSGAKRAKKTWRITVGAKYATFRIYAVEGVAQ
jgi:hypothetical protein